MMLYSWLAALSLLLQQTPASPEAPALISKARFLAGKKPAAVVLPPQGYTTGKSGVRVGQCPWLKNAADSEQLTYVALGVSKAAPNLFFSKATGYNGYSVVATDRQTCRSITLTGYPLLNGSCLACFNDEETTDVQDVLSVWRLSPTGQLRLRKKIPLPKNQIHYSPQEVRFSPDGQQLYYLNTAHQYVAVALPR
jgi:DNA-binding beta-propeller fold protein YncE